MTRSKKIAAAAETNSNQTARDASRRQARARDLSIERMAPIPMSPKLQPADPPLPTLPLNEIRNQLEDEHRRAGAIGGLTQLPPDDDDSFSIREMDDFSPQDSRADLLAKYLQKWKKAGWRPNVPSADLEAKVRRTISEDEKLEAAVKQYRLFINPTKMRTMLVQYPNRELGQEYREANGQKPSELRIKPKCGVIEMDIPLNIHHNYDKEKGIDYGEAMRASWVVQQGGSYGLAGGLGVGPKPSAKDVRRAPMPKGPSREKLLQNFDDANNKGHVMNKITLGGRIFPFKDGEPIYMFVTFKGDICTFTRIDAIVQVRPQFDHVDALRDLEKQSAAHTDRTADDTAADDADEGEAKAVNVAVKSAETLEELDLYGGMSATNKLLKAIRDEPWQKLKWIDQDDQESYDIYDENLVYQDPKNAPQLISEMTNEQYLDALSCPRIDPVKQGARILGGDNASTTTEATGTNGEQTSIEETTEEEIEHVNLLDDENLSSGVVRPPTRRAQARVEMVARQLSVATQNVKSSQRNMAMRDVEVKIQNMFRNKPDYGFLFPGDPHNRYYKWRVAENRANRGVDPKFDLTGFGDGP